MPGHDLRGGVPIHGMNTSGIDRSQQVRSLGFEAGPSSIQGSEPLDRLLDSVFEHTFDSIRVCP